MEQDKKAEAKVERDRKLGKHRSPLQVMAGLIYMIKPLLGWMFVAIFMGCLGNLAATFLTIFGGYGMLDVAGIDVGFSFFTVVTILVIFAVMRGILRYAEQSCNHYIAFKLLARIRHQIFGALRKLAPAKLDGSEKGNLISIITSDIELLEVFYAHTISPIAIAVITSIVMTIFLGMQHPLLGVIALASYGIVGLVIPVRNSRKGRKRGQDYRDSFGDLNTAVLDNLYGLEEIVQYQQKENRMEDMAWKTGQLEKTSEKLKKDENVQRITTDTVILASGILMLMVCGYLVQTGQMEFYQGVAAVIGMMSSFGPTAALSALSNNLNHTLASGNRVLNLLAESPAVKENLEGAELPVGEAVFQNVRFCYEDAKENVLEGFYAEFEPGKVHGILGKSGCGKSTLLKLMMRFYQVDAGSIRYGGEDVNDIRTESLRKGISYVTQETFLFHDTIENNIRIADENATREEVIEAAKKASIHEFILSLPHGYDTRLTELGDCISGGERQRIGIARAFLHKSRMILLDEPTSNIDSLNEGIILKSLEREKKDKTILLVSHRKSTMGIADQVVSM
ncbi:ABC transporter ATP-binding protein/permease [Faecalicatena sp. AGMB00832]|uniref:ABC transporter ATP-binding protein/permease n=1 Tax=Faecalicatena faecalis TaxID=2726362 RepID=A0ABS6D7Y0_9FIRM|nr:MULTISPECIES: ABC transporter ATP-binding protein [Faecalicatena]MBU3877715.1 ABC transporter ATP-binding protein/permease [Faecalicatena faecalis]MCI6466184.1 ABC transporter ATP-binding protein/permease [Faecalicatena sp.]MDY5619350.1 ABC transporter ATP-binding protein [Lachnospiraceae bacterium]